MMQRVFLLGAGASRELFFNIDHIDGGYNTFRRERLSCQGPLSTGFTWDAGQLMRREGGARYAPYGFRYDKQQHRLEMVPEEANIVRLIYAMYLNGQSTLKIAGYLYQKGYKTRSGGRFHTKLVLDILKRPLYVGKIVWNQKHYDKRQKTRKGYRAVRNPVKDHIIAVGKHEPIISQEDFDRVQELLAKNRKGVSQRANNREYPVSGITFCARCNHKYQGTLSNSGRRSKKRWYRCISLSQHNITCSNPAIPADALEPQVYVILEQLLSHPAVRQGRMDLLAQSCVQINDGTLEQQSKEVRAALKVNLEKQDKLTSVYLAGTIASEVFQDQCAKLRDEEQQLKQTIAKIEMQLVQRERSANYQKLLQRVVEDFDATLKKLDITRKKELLQLIFKRAVVDNGKLVEVELYEPFQTMYNTILADRNSKDQKEFQGECKSACISPLTDAHSSGNLKLPVAPQDASQASWEDPAEVLQAVAEGFRLVLAET